ncbi:alanyl-tRNA editing protein [Archangium sp.]|uniref:alanyl-tRNA editing protein n=1 Tax=Archangium sp. TaxID=1872627 RepID=UPI00286A8F3E|nr:alanyl-tRNA editing protein [Archangium sp.]
MTEELYLEDFYLRTCTATVTAADAVGIRLDRTVFYPMGGGQPGDTGVLRRTDGSGVRIADTRKGQVPGEVLHIPAQGEPMPTPGEVVAVELDWDRRYRHMRMHTCLHLLCAAVPAGVTGGQVGDTRSRLDFDVGELNLDKDVLTARLNAFIAGNHPVQPRWITDAEMQSQPELVRTMSVKPPTGLGRVRILAIEGVDLQPCGGTHVRATGEIGRVVVEKIENKGKRNRRIVVALGE